MNRNDFDLNQLEITHRLLLNGLSICTSKNVHSSFLFGKLIFNSILPQFKSYIQNNKVLDLGCGNGLLSIQTILLGASRVVATDINKEALENTVLNWKENNLPLDRLDLFLSNCFQGIPNEFKGKFETIITNTPSQPLLKTNKNKLTDRSDPFSWNEAGVDGRLVLDKLLSEGYKWLLNKGIIIFSTSSRQNWDKTRKILDQMVSQRVVSNWEILLEKPFELSEDYLPYIPIWQNLMLKNNSQEKYIWYDQTSGKWMHMGYFVIIGK